METRRYLTDEELKKVQETVLEMLLEVDRICRKYNITYYLGGGTLLGAVRYKGFIPWDDDVDLIMLRKGYEKFRKAVRKELDSKYFFQDYDTDPNAYYVYPKIRRNGSIYVTEFGEKQDMHQGIFLDIFIHDKTSDSKLGQKIHIWQTKACRAMIAATWSKQLYDRKPKVFYALVNFMIKKTTPAFWSKALRRVLVRYRDKNTSYSFDGVGEHIDHGVFRYEWLGKPKYMEFCGHMLPVPSDTHNYLIFSYGEDYMTPPPEKDRISNHMIARLKLPED